MPLPSPVAIEYLHRRYAADEAEFERIFGHCQIVWAIADELIRARHLDVDVRLVKAGALLHDVGVYKLYDGEAYIRHGVLGERLLAQEGIDSRLQRIAARHTGTGITKHDIEATDLPLPVADYVPQSVEEQLVAYADKFHSKYPELRFNSVESIKADLGRYGANKVAQFTKWMELFGVPDLTALADHYKQKIT